jgi:hypothetical protein
MVAGLGNDFSSGCAGVVHKLTNILLAEASEA